MTELEDACEDEGAGSDDEPSLGSFDRMSNQVKAWQARAVDADVD